MERKEGNEDEVPVRLCPRCPKVGRTPPNEREVGKTGKLWGYCKPCMYAYQKERRDAQNTLLQQNAAELSEEIREALRVLAPKVRGRRPGDNKCPRCNANPRSKDSAYCKDCDAAYRRDRREARVAELNARVAEAQIAELRRRQEIDAEFEKAFGFKPKPQDEGDEDL
jgi:hypothetical protein